MHSDAGQAPDPQRPTNRRIIGGITLYPQQLAKVTAYASAHGISRSEAIRRLIDERL
jgi:hypothetical protein